MMPPHSFLPSSPPLCLILAQGRIEYDYNYGKGIAISSICLLVCFFMATLGPRGYSTLAVGFFFVKLAALLLSAGRCATVIGRRNMEQSARAA